jgi:hypothetical protein
VHRESPVVLLVDDHEDSVAMYAIGLLAMGFQPVTRELQTMASTTRVGSSPTSSSPT